MPDEWYYRVLGEEFGPVPFENIVELVESGHLARDDHLRRGESGEWIRAHSVMGLFSGSSELDELADLSELNIDDFEIVSSSASPAPQRPAADGPGELLDLSELNVVSESELAPLPMTGPVSVEPAAADAWPPAAAAEPPFELPVDASSDDEPWSDPPPAEDPFVESPPAVELSEDENEVGDEFETAATGDRWFCRIDGVEHGPITFDELQGMARRKRLFCDNDVRPGDDGEWMPAGSLDGLFESPPQAAEAAAAWPAGAGATSVSAGAARILANAGATGAASATRAKRTRPKRERKPWPPLGDLLKSKGAVVAGILVLLVAGGAGAFMLLGSGWSDREYYDLLDQIWTEHKQLRDRQAPDAEWAPLVTRGEQLAAEIQKQLDRPGAAAEPARLRLIWAGRDCLVPMLKGARRQANANEKEFAGYMHEISDLLAEQAAAN